MQPKDPIAQQFTHAHARKDVQKAPKLGAKL